MHSYVDIYSYKVCVDTVQITGSTMAEEGQILGLLIYCLN